MRPTLARTWSILTKQALLTARAAGAATGDSHGTRPSANVTNDQSKSGLSSRAGCCSAGAAIWVGLAVLTVATYWSTLSFGFIDYDDPSYVSLNRHVLGGLSWEGIKWALTNVHGYYHPLTLLSLMLDTSLFGPTPEGYHFTNLVLHVACVLLVYALSRRIIQATWLSALPALVLALHPINVESVAWIAERRGLLSSVFYFSCVLVYLKGVQSRPRECLLLVTLLFCLGALAKPMIVTLPLALLLLDYWPLKRLSGASVRVWRQRVVEKAPLLVLAVGAAYLCYRLQGQSGVIVNDLPAEIRLSNAARAYAFTFSKLMWPVGLAAFYPYPEHSLPSGLSAVGALIVATAVVLAAGRRYPGLLFGWAWFIVTLAPVAGAVKFGAAFVADRYAYVPQIGLAIGLGAWLGEWGQRHKRLLIAGLVCLSVWFARTMGVAWSQIELWRSSESLFQATVQRTGPNAVAHCVLGSHFYNTKRYKEAEEQYVQALQVNPRHNGAWYNLGLTLVAVDRLSEAESCFQVASRLSPSHKEAATNARRVRRQLEERRSNYNNHQPTQ